MGIELVLVNGQPRRRRDAKGGNEDPPPGLAALARCRFRPRAEEPRRDGETDCRSQKAAGDDVDQEVVAEVNPRETAEEGHEREERSGRGKRARQHCGDRKGGRCVTRREAVRVERVRAGDVEEELQSVRGEPGKRRGEQDREPHSDEAPVPRQETRDGQHEPDRGRGEAVRQQIQDLEDTLEKRGTDQRTGEPDDVDSHSASARHRGSFWTAAGAGPFGTCPRDLLRPVPATCPMTSSSQSATRFSISAKLGATKRTFW